MTPFQATNLFLSKQLSKSLIGITNEITHLSSKSQIFERFMKNVSLIRRLPYVVVMDEPLLHNSKGVLETFLVGIRPMTLITLVHGIIYALFY